MLILWCLFYFFCLAVLLLFLCSLWHRGCFFFFFFPIACSIPFSIPCEVGLVVITSFALFLSWEFLIYTLVLVDSFSGYNSLVWHIWSFRSWNTSYQPAHFGLKIFCQIIRYYYDLAFVIDLTFLSCSLCYPLFILSP